MKFSASFHLTSLALKNIFLPTNLIWSIMLVYFLLFFASSQNVYHRRRMPGQHVSLNTAQALSASNPMAQLSEEHMHGLSPDDSSGVRPNIYLEGLRREQGKSTTARYTERASLQMHAARATPVSPEVDPVYQILESETLSPVSVLAQSQDTSDYYQLTTALQPVTPIAMPQETSTYYEIKPAQRTMSVSYEISDEVGLSSPCTLATCTGGDSSKAEDEYTLLGKTNEQIYDKLVDGDPFADYVTGNTGY